MADRDQQTEAASRIPGSKAAQLFTGAKDMLEGKLKAGMQQLNKLSGGEARDDELPGRDQSTLPATENAGIETRGAAADEQLAQAADCVATQTGTDPTAEAPAVPMSPEKGAPSIAPNTLASSGGMGVTTGGGGSGSTPGDPREGLGQGSQDVNTVARHVDMPHAQHHMLLSAQERAGKIFLQEPTIKGAGGVVHGVMPASLLMHASPNAKRTGGSAKAATAGVPESEANEERSNAVASHVSPSVLSPEEACPDANTEGVRQV